MLEVVHHGSDKRTENRRKLSRHAASSGVPSREAAIIGKFDNAFHGPKAIIIIPRGNAPGALWTTPGAKIETCPNAQQAADGTIYLTWDYNRSKDQEILMTTFREEDLLAANDEVTTRVKINRRLVSKAGST